LAARPPVWLSRLQPQSLPFRSTKGPSRASTQKGARPAQTDQPPLRPAKCFWCHWQAPRVSEHGLRSPGSASGLPSMS
jgi:hypothetical protein